MHYWFQLHLASLGSLRGEISELHSRLQRTVQDRDTLEQALAKTQVILRGFTAFPCGLLLVWVFIAIIS